MRILAIIIFLFLAGTIQAQTKTNKDSVIILSPLLNSETDTIGVTYMTDNMFRTGFNQSVRQIKSIEDLGNNLYRIKEVGGHMQTYGYKLNYSSFIDITTVGRLPKVQSEYAQGRNGEWKGADQSEPFSWGPKISSLEYSGTNYPYDQKGSLVPAGSGNGIKAQTYDPTDFFRTGVSFGNSVDIKFPGLFRKGISSLSIGQKKNVSPIPNGYREAYNISYGINKIKIKRFTTQFNVLYKSSYGKLTEQGANLATLMYSVLTTPPTFDNMNGLSNKQAAKESSAWQLADGSIRSFSPQHVSNPYMLVNELPDREKSENLTALAKTEYNNNRFRASASFSFDKLWDNRYNGVINPYYSRSTFRKEQLSNLSAGTNFSYRLKDYDPDIELIANYGFKRTTDKLNKESIFDINNLVSPIINNKLDRNAHDIRYGGKLTTNYSNFNLEIYNKHYFSNTAKSSDYVNLFPEIGFRWDMEKFIDNTFDRYNKNFTIYGSFNRSIGESSLVYRDLAVLSTTGYSSQFQNYFEYTDIFYHTGLKPETYTKGELGLRYHTYRNNFNVELNGFYYNTHNFISPDIDNTSSPVLRNIGRLRNYGYHISAFYYHIFDYYNSSRLNIRFNFSQSRNKVSAVYGDAPFIRMAGFTDIATVFAKDQPLGAIYGTSYLRNDRGQILIDNDGYPLVDTDIKKLGDPTPDFIMTLYPTFNWRNFGLSFILEYSQGGDRWNGTRAFMDYHGVSQGSAKQRDIKGYIFKGVDQSGTANTKPIDFYNPNDNIQNNRWVRYGISGVGEEYIESATYLRLSDITVSYTLHNRNRSQFIKAIKLSLKGQNLLLLTNYKGVDPSSSLFGYAAGKGLDLFNQPSIRSYSFTLSLDL